jgi:hypothetical protein
MICSFLAFLDDEEGRVGCLLHPTRWEGRDIRESRAFQLLTGFACGAPDFFCSGALWFQRARGEEMARFEEETQGMDWHRYSNCVRYYGSQAPEENHDIPVEQN